MIINGLEKLSLVDFPGKTVCTTFSGACNMRCTFCHNAVLVLDPTSQPTISEETVLNYLNKRKGILDGICISGGEPTLQKDLPDFMRKCKEIDGITVKLDSNGSNPDLLNKLIDEKLVDYIAMDIKNSKQKYPLTTNVNLDISKIEESVKLLMTSGIDYEFRTTIVNELHNLEDIRSIGEWLRGAKRYYLQKFEDKGGCIKSGLHPVPLDAAKNMKETLKEFIFNVELRSYE